MSHNYKLTNNAYQLTVTIEDKEICIRLKDLAMDFEIASGAYIYRASRSHDEGSILAKWLKDAAVETSDSEIKITGMLAGLKLEHTLKLSNDHAVLVEQIILHNPTEDIIELEDFASGMKRRIANEVGSIFPELDKDRLIAIPFRHRPTDPADFDIDFRMSDLIKRPGREHSANKWPPSYPRYGYLPSMQWASEGWAWIHGEHTLGIFKFNQEAMEFSVLSPEPDEDGLALRFGGASVVAEEPSSLRKIQPGQTIELGVTRYETVEGDYKQAYYAFRSFLDENGCRFPQAYTPPVHWNELYDNPEWNLSTPGNPKRRMTRPVTYTKELIEEEAKKAREYSCESLYLDPGWDTNFGTFLWGKDWLGQREQFIKEIRDKYGLGVSLHCPLATWMSRDGRGVQSWPEEAFQMDKEGNIIEGAVCLGSKQYLDEAKKRLLEHCADGVVFLMFDGNWWNGGCWNPNHGHPVPYTMEEHIRANVELARRIHEKYPDVLIEMHDMIAGGAVQRYTPVYYKYSLPKSYDENWGFELMWNPMEDIRSGRARSLYYYNLGCNVPIYLHIDLRDDNEHCLVLWWYASTCRHLGIGGTHSNQRVVEAQKLAMKKYRKLERFYKEGEFYGMHEEAHLHVLPDENAFVVNLFNLSNESRVISGSISSEEIGIDRDRWYINPKRGRFDRKNGTFSIGRRMPPWSAETIEMHPITSD